MKARDKITGKEMQIQNLHRGNAVSYSFGVMSGCHSELTGSQATSQFGANDILLHGYGDFDWLLISFFD